MLVEVGVGLGPARRLGFFEQCEERCPKRWTLSTFRHHVHGFGYKCDRVGASFLAVDASFLVRGGGFEDVEAMRAEPCVEMLSLVKERELATFQL